MASKKKKLKTVSRVFAGRVANGPRSTYRFYDPTTKKYIYFKAGRARLYIGYAYKLLSDAEGVYAPSKMECDWDYSFEDTKLHGIWHMEQAAHTEERKQQASAKKLSKNEEVFPILDTLREKMLDLDFGTRLLFAESVRRYLLTETIKPKQREEQQ